ncbi:MAG: hypothetical protein A2V81_01230 [Candidatus Abawacabacteria bacterium RBG_16_42_10]|uniref:Four helix bundle protein n=1 Tax=Candidatus Abawacabacteria bacterium RBG_16_42_10 TaxID=1817814 RepID=A0A1F4XIP5_9BACT|nr:MAG: hypothetical protein A2V81_01230 [Candidatus Abawacabacteria bacterium RBG_16_42_10]
MFDFQKLIVYQKAKQFYHEALIHVIWNNRVDLGMKDQLRRAARSIAHNIAEGAGKYTKPDKRRYYVCAKASVYECFAALELIEMEMLISKTVMDNFHNQLVELSKMLTGLIKSQS